MPQLLVRNLADDVVQALKRRAAEHGNSVEEEHRELLRSVLLADREQKPDFKTLLAAVPEGEDEWFERARDPGRPVDL